MSALPQPIQWVTLYDLVQLAYYHCNDELWTWFESFNDDRLARLISELSERVESGHYDRIPLSMHGISRTGRGIKDLLGFACSEQSRRYCICDAQELKETWI